MMQKYKQFIFEHYGFDFETGVLTMKYSYDNELFFIETVEFSLPKKRDKIDREALDALCFYTFIVAGSSYYKLFVAPEFKLPKPVDYWQADFFNMIYSGGLSQFVYENKLDPSVLAKFIATDESSHCAGSYHGEGIVLMQSGGKDSLLAAELLKKADINFVGWHMSTTGSYPKVIDDAVKEVIVSRRKIDLVALQQGMKNGGLNGHVPFSAIFAGFGLIQAVLLNKEFLIASNESSADEANVEIDGYKVNHQFSKTYGVELAVQEYLSRYVSHDLKYGSILRPFDELTVGRLFAKYAWSKYRKKFSSCNLANYKQGEDDGELTWDGTCPKCANTFLLLAPFVDKAELLEMFNGKNLLTAEDMTETYRQLMGMSEIKPFECVGTFTEMQEAYRRAIKKSKEYKNPHIIIDDRDYEESMGEYQPIFDELINYEKLI